MPEEEKRLSSEATVVKAEETAQGARSESVETPPTATAEVPVKKKKNPVVIIVLVLLGLAALCCVTFGAIFYFAYNATQNGPQATALKTLYTELSNDNKTAVQAVSGEELYQDLYTANASGATLASYFKGNIVKVIITNVSIKNDTATIEYTIVVKNNQEMFSTLNYAELRKSNDKWVVVYFGDKANQQTTVTPTTDFDYDF